jgi:hypothetical protein
VLRHPDYWSPGRRAHQIVQLHDLHELCLSISATGVPRPQEYACCLTQGEQPTWPGRDAAFSEFPRQSKTLRFMHDQNPYFEPGVWDVGSWAVRTADWRYVEWDDGTRALYDLNGDLRETRSVHNDRPGVCEQLRDMLQTHRSEGLAASATTEPDELMDEAVLERLRALGYIE